MESESKTMLHIDPQKIMSVVRLLKKAAKLKSIYDENLVAWDFIWKLEKKSK